MQFPFWKKKAVEATAIYDIELTVLAPENMADEAKLLLPGRSKAASDPFQMQKRTKNFFFS